MPAQEHARDLREAEVMCLTRVGTCSRTPSPADGNNADVSITYRVFQSRASEPPHGAWPLPAQMERGSVHFQEAVGQFHKSLGKSLAARTVAETMDPSRGRSPGSPGGESADRQEGSYVFKTAVLDAAEAYVLSVAHDQLGFLAQRIRGLVVVGHFEFGDLIGPALEQVALNRVAAALGNAANRSRANVAQGWTEAFTWQLDGKKGARLTLFTSQAPGAGAKRWSAAEVGHLAATAAEALGGSETTGVVSSVVASAAWALRNNGSVFLAWQMPF